MDRPEPLDDSLVYSATGFHTAHDYVIDMVAALRAQDMQVEHYYPELGHGTAAPRGPRRRYPGA